jgi:hypothetical protein
MAKKKVKRKSVENKREVVPIHTRKEITPKRRLSIDKSDGIIAIMAAILVTLIAVLNFKYSVIAAVFMMIIYAAYKLFKK